jgi:TolB-like protein/DNA-binding winged helix-turn-helix (wHTH) protein/tetratricopeptide (TPR) repeat protein
MAEVASAPRVVRFGAFEVDLAAGELRKKGVRIRLQEQPFRVLAVLLERPGQVVTREQLKQRLWPGTVVDFDHGLNTSINKLREALGDSADAPRFVETLPRRGYRFVYPVDAAPPPAANGTFPRATQIPSSLDGASREVVEVASPNVAAPAPRARRPRVRTVFAVAVPAVLLMLLAADVRGMRRRVLGSEGLAIASIAVLPLRNASADPGRDYYAEGITEALVTELGKIGALRVVSYQSAARYRGTEKPLAEIARELGVDALVVGDVLESGSRIRMTVRLVQASSDRELWAETHEFDPSDVLVAQKDLVRDVADRIRARVMPREQVRLAFSRRIDPAAYEAYLLGRAHLARAPNAETAAKAAEYFHVAIEKDPGFAPAYAGLAELEMRLRGSSTRSFSTARIRTRQWAEKALELDDTLAEAHMTLARIAQQEWDWTGAEREYRRAIELNPSLAKARIWYAQFLCAMRRFEDALTQARRAQQLDPASPLVNTWAGAAYQYAGRREEASASWKKALELDPGYSDARLTIARTHVTLGEYEDAIAELRRAMSLDARQSLILGALAHTYGRAGQREEALKVLDELTRLEASEPGLVPLFGGIWAYAGLGDRDQAFARLERAFTERSDRMVWLQVDPLLEPLRPDPRFQDLVRRMGLPAVSAPRAP